MEDPKRLPRMLSIKEVQKFYFHAMGYKKLKCFLLKYIPYIKVGGVYYFSRKKLEDLIETEISTEFRISIDDYS